jgi:hypothetical protein
MFMPTISNKIFVTYVPTYLYSSSCAAGGTTSVDCAERHRKTLAGFPHVIKDLQEVSF